MSESSIEMQVFTFPSVGDGKPMHAVIWADEALETPRGIIQIVHGMSEYIERYDHLARFFAQHGFVVCGEDHIGHGQSVGSPEEWGVMPAKTGKGILVENVHALRGIMEERYGEQVPYFVYGHSMGSFISRLYLAKHGADLAGCILSGTGFQPAAVALGGRALARALSSSKGETYRSATINGMADGAYGKAIKDARTSFDWLSTDPAVVDTYIADPACGFMFSVGGYAVLMDLLVELAGAKHMAELPKDTPVFFAAGADDPVGDSGRGVLKVFGAYRKAGFADVDLRLYPGMRHEIHNEVDRDKVYADLLKWLEAHL